PSPTRVPAAIQCQSELPGNRRIGGRGEAPRPPKSERSMMRARRHPLEPAAQAHSRIRQSYKALVTERAHMAQLAKPNVVYHADWSSIAAKRSCARVVLATAGRYTALAPEPVGFPGSLISKLRQGTGGNVAGVRGAWLSD